MKRAIALVLAVSLAVSGCAAARTSSSSQPAISPAPTDPAIATFVRSLPPGSRVRLDATGRRTFHGTLLQATDETVTLQRRTRVPEPPVTVPMRDVLRVSIDASSSTGRAIAIGAAIGAGVSIGVLWLIAAIALSD